MNYLLGDRTVGQAYLTLKDAVSEAGIKLPQALIEVQPSALAPAAEDPDAAHSGSEGIAESISASSPLGKAAEPESSPDGSGGSKFRISLKIPSLFWKILAAIIIIGGTGTFAVFTLKRRRAQEEAALLERRRRRAERLKETGISEAEFDLMMQEKRTFSPGREYDSTRKKGRKGR